MAIDQKAMLHWINMQIAILAADEWWLDDEESARLIMLKQISDLIHQDYFSDPPQEAMND